tara:strand:- start:3 stop:410 length:408 start_codon:yes stop_codon:yes gene_type:complete
MSFVFKSTTLNAANIIYRVGRFKQYDNKWFKKITKLSKIIKKGHRYNLRQWRFSWWYRDDDCSDYTINFISRGFTGTTYRGYRGVDKFRHEHKNKFILKKVDWTKAEMIDNLKQNNIKYKKSWSKDKLYPLLFSF